MRLSLLAWAYPSITRRTDRGLRQYLDRKESDVFILSGAEDLIPVAAAGGQWLEETREGYRVALPAPHRRPAHPHRAGRALTDAADTFWRTPSDFVLRYRCEKQLKYHVRWGVPRSHSLERKISDSITHLSRWARAQKAASRYLKC